MFDGVVSPSLALSVRVPIQSGYAAVPERGWGSGREDPVLLEVGDVVRDGRGWEIETAPDLSPQLRPGGHEIGHGGSPCTHRRTLLVW